VGFRTYVDLGPEIGSEETVGSGNGSVSGLDEVTHTECRRNGCEYQAVTKGRGRRTYVEVFPRDWV